MSQRLHVTPSRLAAAAAAAVLALGTLAVSAPGSQAASPRPGSSRHHLPGSRPHWLGKARRLGSVGSSQRIDFGVLLKMRDQAGAEAAIRQLSDPTSADYGRWLSDAQFRQRYAPTTSDVHAVQSWLRSEGFSVGSTMRSGMFVEASGTASQVEKAFDTTMSRYQFRGRTVRANSTGISLSGSTPAAVVGAVSGVVGLDQGATRKQPADTLPGPDTGFRAGHPCSAYNGQKLAVDKPPAYGSKHPYVVCGYTPQQLQSGYGETPMLKAGTTGKGVTVAITDAFASPTLVRDTRIYNAVHHQPQFRPGQLRQITPGPDGYDQVDYCGGAGWYGEETLDVESVHAMAPGAKIVYVGAKDCLDGLDTAWATTIDNHTADIVTNSWTDGVDDLADLGQSYIDFYQAFSTEAALTGITVNFSSGDDGDHTAGGTDPAAKSVEFPADLPYVTAVGGTSVFIGKQGQWQGEYGWQSAYSTLTDGAWDPTPPGVYSSGGGGGTSQLFAQPFYQRGVVPSSVSQYYGGAPMRSLPDISMAADPNTGILVGQTQTFSDGTYWDQYRIGGTSVSSPLLAGVLAVADQKAGHALGFVNPLYYHLHGRAIHDIVAPTYPVARVRTNYDNSENASDGLTFLLQTVDVQSSTLHSTPGWDDETGVGSPSGPAFFGALARAARRP